jgi:hypothetical protein
MQTLGDKSMAFSQYCRGGSAPIHPNPGNHPL